MPDNFRKEEHEEILEAFLRVMSKNGGSLLVRIDVLATYQQDSELQNLISCISPGRSRYT